MLQILRRGAGAPETVEPGAGWRLPEDAVWIELVHPTREEELAVEGALGLGLPTREEMAEIEPSSRLYQDDSAVFLTATLLCGAEAGRPEAGPVTFVLAQERLVTIRYVQPHAFELFAAQAGRQPELSRDGTAVLMGLLEIVVDRTADLLERVSAQVEHISNLIMRQERAGSFKPVLARLAVAQHANTKARDSLVSLSRLMSYAMLTQPFAGRKEQREALRSLVRDARSLTEQSSYVASNLAFLLNAALGLINVHQNEVTKVFSIYAVVLLPPTLLGTWWGMNFELMPELHVPRLYPWGPLVLMLASAALPFLWFKRKGWL